MTIPTNLIENALALTGKTMEEMQTITPDWSNWWFSIEKFCFYLLSPEFIEKYRKIYDDSDTYIRDAEWNPIESIYTPKEWGKALTWTACAIWWAIYEYQRKDEEFPDWNPEPLISLLEKIPTP